MQRYNQVPLFRALSAASADSEKFLPKIAARGYFCMYSPNEEIRKDKKN